MIYSRVLIFFLLYTPTKSDSLSVKCGIHIAKKIEQKLKETFLKTTGYDKLRETFNGLYEEKVFTEDSIDVFNVSKEYGARLKDLLGKHIAKVVKLKHVAEKLYANYTEDDNIQPFNYFNRKNKPENHVVMERTFSTVQKVNVNKSYVQVPTDIFRNHKSILNDAKWTQPMDEVFLANHKEIPSLLWQYFGSETGMLRSFPGKNTPWDKLDLYDCRRRLWYNQAINSPKDILIAVDLSGSMTGSHFTIAKVTIKSLIATLQQDDFFSVIYFNRDKVHFLTPCSPHLVQATSSNKDMFQDAIDNLPLPHGTSNMLDVLEKAFSILRDHEKSSTETAHCTKAVMLVADSVEHNDVLHDRLFKLNQDGDVVIFSYIVGSGKDDQELQRLACDNGGRFYNFPSVSNVWNGVLDYQKVLSKPIGKLENDSIIFTPLYLDGGGLGMMATISAPVFGNTRLSKQLLGVVGVDIRVNLLELQNPIKKLGVFGHAFAINNNGLFLTHPKFRDQSGYLPDPATVSLNEVQHMINPNDSIRLLKEMVDKKTGCMHAEQDWLFPDRQNTRVVRYNVTFCYQPVAKTPFRSGVAIPKQNLQVLVVSCTKTHEFFSNGLKGLITKKAGKTVEVAKWIYCDIRAKEQDNFPESVKIYPTAQEIHDYLVNQSNSTDYLSNQSNSTENKRGKKLENKCNKELIDELLVSSALVSNFTEKRWSLSVLKKHNITGVYIITSSGYICELRSTALKQQINRDIFQEKGYVHPASFTFTKEFQTLVVTVPIKEVTRRTNRMHNNEPLSLSAGRGIHITDHNILVGVTGMSFSSDVLNTDLVEVLAECKNSYTHIRERHSQLFLIDENGYVVASSQGNHDVGVFFGFVNGNLMREFIAHSIYEKLIYNDTQAECEKMYFQSSSSKSSSFRNILTNLIMILSNVIRHFFTVTLSAAHPFRSVTSSSYFFKNISCTKQISIYKRTNDRQYYFGSIPGECKQDFIYILLNETNLAFVGTTNGCLQTPMSHILSNEPIRIGESDGCGRTLPYRIPLDGCYKLTGDNVECSSKEDERAKVKMYITLAGTFVVLVFTIFLFACS